MLRLNFYKAECEVVGGVMCAKLKFSRFFELIRRFIYFFGDIGVGTMSHVRA